MNDRARRPTQTNVKVGGESDDWQRMDEVGTVAGVPAADDLWRTRHPAPK